MGARMRGKPCSLGKGKCMGRKYLAADGVAMERVGRGGETGERALP
jgi:hypothetical protein